MFKFSTFLNLRIIIFFWVFVECTAISAAVLVFGFGVICILHHKARASRLKNPLVVIFELLVCKAKVAENFKKN